MNKIMRRISLIVVVFVAMLGPLSVAGKTPEATVDMRLNAGRMDAGVEVTLNALEQGAVISPLLFGHNLEITRRAVWSGLSAEMVANRKFAAAKDNRPKRWEAVGAEDAVRIDSSVAYAGKQSARIKVPAQGTPFGIRQQQDVLSVAKGKSYKFRVWVKSEAVRQLQMRVTGDSGKVIFEKKFTCRPGDWQLLSSESVSRVTWTNSALEITSKEAGVFWLGAVSMLPGDAFHGMRRDVIARLKQIKPGAFRFPGGCFAEFYRWQDGLLPVDQRPPIGPTGLSFLLPNSDDYDSHEIGIDEFMALCRELDAEPAITLRVSESPVEDAASWVEYCNGDRSTKWGKIRAERGQKESYAVKTWFVGNEVYSFGRGGMNNPGNYAKKAKEVAEAVMKIDPAVNLVGCTDLVYGNINKGWNDPLMAQAGSLMAYASVHDYIQDSLRPADLQAYAAAATRHRKPAFERIFKELRKPIVYDEWNTAWGGAGSVGMGFCVAGVLNLLCREGADLNIREAYYFQPVTEGAITVKPLSAELDVAGYVFELFKDHQGNRALKVSGPAPVDLCASLTPDRKQIIVTMINGAAVEQAVTFRLSDGTVARKPAEVQYLVSRTSQPKATVLDLTEGQVAIADGNRLDVKLPPWSMARMSMRIKKVTAKGP